MTSGSGRPTIQGRRLTLRMAVTTSGCTRGPGSVPAETARAFEGSTRRLNHAAAICERPALYTHANKTVVISRHLRRAVPRRVQPFSEERGPAIERET